MTFSNHQRRLDLLTTSNTRKAKNNEINTYSTPSPPHKKKKQKEDSFNFGFGKYKISLFAVESPVFFTGLQISSF